MIEEVCGTCGSVVGAGCPVIDLVEEEIGPEVKGPVMIEATLTFKKDWYFPDRCPDFKDVEDLAKQFIPGINKVEPTRIKFDAWGHSPIVEIGFVGFID